MYQVIANFESYDPLDDVHSDWEDIDWREGLGDPQPELDYRVFLYIEDGQDAELSDRLFHFAGGAAGEFRIEVYEDDSLLGEQHVGSAEFFWTSDFDGVGDDSEWTSLDDFETKTWERDGFALDTSSGEFSVESGEPFYLRLVISEVPPGGLPPGGF